MLSYGRVVDGTLCIKSLSGCSLVDNLLILGCSGTPLGCSGVALGLLWDCFGTALGLLWGCSGAALFLGGSEADALVLL